jgi:hypothetical protein
MGTSEKHCKSCICDGNSESSTGLKPRDFARRYGLSDFAVYQGIKNGSIPSIRVGRRYIVLPRRFEAMVSQNETVG